MKILNKENNQPVIYIQQKNIKAIIKYEDRVPKSLLRLAKRLNLSEYDTPQDEEFVRINNTKDIKYLEAIEWIPDYRELHDCKDEELLEKTSQLTLELQDIHDLFIASSIDQRSTYNFTNEYGKKNLLKKDIDAYLLTRQGKYNTPITIPLVIDGTAGIAESNGSLRFGLSLDHKKVLIEKKDGTLFEKNCKLNLLEIQTGLIIIATEENLSPNEPGELNFHVYPESTYRYLVAEHSFQATKDYVPPIIEEQQPTRIQPEQKKKSIFKRVFNSNKKDEN